MADPGGRPSQPEPAREGSPTPFRVVLADDHLPYRDGLAEAIMREPRLELLEAVADGAVAVEAIRRHEPEVALLDVRMPGIDGLEAARRLRAHRTTVVLLTGSSPAALGGAASAAAWSSSPTSSRSGRSRTDRTRPSRKIG
jgi:DNA-binding NarL/FixJ family response regulator